jgi:hypothetical protein
MPDERRRDDGGGRDTVVDKPPSHSTRGSPMAPVSLPNIAWSAIAVGAVTTFPRYLCEGRPN